MTNWGYENDDALNSLGNDNVNDGPKALRDAYAALKAQNEELNKKLTSFLEETQKEKVQKTFENLGIPGAAAIYQGPADPKAAEEWAKSMQQVFGGAPGGNPVVTNETETEAEQPKLPASMQAQFERMTAAGQDGIPIGNIEAAAGSIGDASNTADIVAAFQRMQHM